MLFTELGLAEPIVRAVLAKGYTTATPIQAQAIVPALEGKDVLGCAQTGTGKTAAFALPILHRLSTKVEGPVRARALVLCPTRELAMQIRDAFKAYGSHLGLRYTLIFGGVNQNPQVQDLRRGVDVIVATPGRLMDLMNQGHVDLRGIETLILDEADRMLDMGFIHDIRKISQQLPSTRQTLLFSATISPEIRRLADTMLRSPTVVKIEAVKATTDLIDQCVYHVERKNKPALLAHLVKDQSMFRTIVFTRTKHGADRLVRQLHERGIKAEAIHGNKAQNARQRALANFKSSKTPVLIATDVASRGIDVDDVTHVVNYDVTHEPETYVHRIGRTGRAGQTGVAISLCDSEERGNLKAIERLLKKNIPVKTDHPVYVNDSHAQSEASEPERRDTRGGPRQDQQRQDAQRQDAQRPQGPRQEGGAGRHPAQQRNRPPHTAGPSAHRVGRPGQGAGARTGGPRRPAPRKAVGR